jgi:hypothetical protein
MKNAAAKSIALVVLSLALAGVVRAQDKTALGGTPSHLTPEEFERLMNRAMGTWILNRAKSTIMSGDALGMPEGFVYERTEDRKGVKFTRPDQPGTTVQMYDGKPYGTTRTIARIPIDEFTIDNIMGENGRRLGHNTQVYSPDGTKSAYIVRRVNEHGQEVVTAIVLWDKVPNGTPIPQPTAGSK